MAESVIDLDAQFLGSFEPKEVTYVTVRLFGQEWRVSEAQNFFIQIQASNFAKNPSSIADLLLDMLHPDDRANFERALVNVPQMDAEALMKIFTALTEAVAARPTKRPSASRSGPSTARSTTPSPATPLSMEAHVLDPSESEIS